MAKSKGKAYIATWNATKVTTEMTGQTINGMDKACQFVVEQARGLVPKRSEIAADNIDYKVEAKGKSITGYVGVKKGKAFYAYFVELGTKGHKVKAGGGGKESTGKKILANKSSQAVFGKEVEIPAMPARPFLRPAIFNNTYQILKLLAGG